MTLPFSFFLHVARAAVCNVNGRASERSLHKFD